MFWPTWWMATWLGWEREMGSKRQMPASSRWPLVIEEAAADDLDGEERAGEVAGQPDLAVGAAAHATDQRVVRDDGCGQDLLGGERRPAGRCAQPESGEGGRRVRLRGLRSGLRILAVHCGRDYLRQAVRRNRGSALPLEVCVSRSCRVRCTWRRFGAMKLLLENLPPSLRGQGDTLARCLEAMKGVTPLGQYCASKSRP